MLLLITKLSNRVPHFYTVGIDYKSDFCRKSSIEEMEKKLWNGANTSPDSDTGSTVFSTRYDQLPFSIEVEQAFPPFRAFNLRSQYASITSPTYNTFTVTSFKWQSVLELLNLIWSLPSITMRKSYATISLNSYFRFNLYVIYILLLSSPRTWTNKHYSRQFLETARICTSW